MQTFTANQNCPCSMQTRDFTWFYSPSLLPLLLLTRKQMVLERIHWKETKQHSYYDSRPSSRHNKGLSLENTCLSTVAMDRQYCAVLLCVGSSYHTHTHTHTRVLENKALIVTKVVQRTSAAYDVSGIGTVFGAFAKIPKSHYYIRHGTTTRLPLDGSSRNLIFMIFQKSVEKIWVSLKSDKTEQVVPRTRLNATLYVHCRSCYLHSARLSPPRSNPWGKNF